MRGRALSVREMTVEEYLDHVGFTCTPTGCLEWNGPKNDNGYGIINLARQGLSDARVHREVYRLRVGPLADDVLLRHSCDNPPCSELTHLAPGTHAQNMADMVERRRHWKHGRATCDEGHDLTEPGATKQYVDGSRCVKCRRRREARWAASTSRVRVS